MKLQKTFRDCQGLTLIETLLALAVFAVGILGVIGLQGSILLGNDLGGSNTVARSLAYDRMNTLLFADYFNPLLDDCTTLGLGTFCHRDIDDGAGNLIAGLAPAAHGPLDEQLRLNNRGRFIREWDVRNATSGGIAGKQIDVRISWWDQPLGGNQRKAGSGLQSRTLVYSGFVIQPTP